MNTNYPATLYSAMNLGEPLYTSENNVEIYEDEWREVIEASGEELTEEESENPIEWVEWEHQGNGIYSNEQYLTADAKHYLLFKLAVAKKDVYGREGDYILEDFMDFIYCKTWEHKNSESWKQQKVEEFAKINDIVLIV